MIVDEAWSSVGLEQPETPFCRVSTASSGPSAGRACWDDDRQYPHSPGVRLIKIDEVTKVSSPRSKSGTPSRRCIRMTQPRGSARSRWISTRRLARRCARPSWRRCSGTIRSSPVAAQ